MSERTRRRVGAIIAPAIAPGSGRNGDMIGLDILSVMSLSELREIEAEPERFRCARHPAYVFGPSGVRPWRKRACIRRRRRTRQTI